MSDPLTLTWMTFVLCLFGGFGLALGIHAGRVAGAMLFGPIKTSSTADVRLPNSIVIRHDQNP